MEVDRYQHLLEAKELEENPRVRVANRGYSDHFNRGEGRFEYRRPIGFMLIEDVLEGLEFRRSPIFRSSDEITYLVEGNIVKVSHNEGQYRSIFVGSDSRDGIIETSELIGLGDMEMTGPRILALDGIPGSIPFRAQVPRWAKERESEAFEELGRANRAARGEGE